MYLISRNEHLKNNNNNNSNNNNTYNNKFKLVPSKFLHYLTLATHLLWKLTNIIHPSPALKKKIAKFYP